MRRVIEQSDMDKTPATIMRLVKELGFDEQTEVTELEKEETKAGNIPIEVIKWLLLQMEPLFWA